MTHYVIEQWTDFVRGLVREPEGSEMELHLGSGCASCLRMVALVRDVVATAEADVDVPDDVFANAAALFAPRLQGAQPRWRQLIADLGFDSQAAIAMEGVRSVHGVTRRLAFSVEDFTVELLIDAAGSQRTVAITGQISMTQESVASPVVPVLLMSGRQVLQRTETNESGEFHLESPRGPSLFLRIPDEAGRREIEVPLGSVVALRQVNRKK